MLYQNIVRLASGSINQVNDAQPGGGITYGPQAGLAGGQLGQEFNLDDSELIYTSSVGTVFGGGFRYVRLAAAATAVVVGQIVFWDIAVVDSLYQVTTSEAGTNPGAQWPAGIVLNNSWSVGNYSVIQTFGPTFVKYRAALTQVPTGVGAAAYCAAAGAGVDNGFADVLNSNAPVSMADVNLLQNRYLGASIDLPTNGGLKLINLRRLSVRG